jgi:hypothetical protein
MQLASSLLGPHILLSTLFPDDRSFADNFINLLIHKIAFFVVYFGDLNTVLTYTLLSAAAEISRRIIRSEWPWRRLRVGDEEVLSHCG